METSACEVSTVLQGPSSILVHAQFHHDRNFQDGVVLTGYLADLLHLPRAEPKSSMLYLEEPLSLCLKREKRSSVETGLQDGSDCEDADEVCWKVSRVAVDERKESSRIWFPGNPEVTKFNRRRFRYAIITYQEDNTAHVRIVKGGEAFDPVQYRLKRKIRAAVMDHEGSVKGAIMLIFFRENYSCLSPKDRNFPASALDQIKSMIDWILEEREHAAQPLSKALYSLIAYLVYGRACNQMVSAGGSAATGPALSCADCKLTGADLALILNKANDESNYHCMAIIAEVAEVWSQVPPETKEVVYEAAECGLYTESPWMVGHLLGTVYRSQPLPSLTHLKVIEWLLTCIFDKPDQFNYKLAVMMIEGYGEAVGQQYVQEHQSTLLNISSLMGLQLYQEGRKAGSWKEPFFALFRRMLTHWKFVLFHPLSLDFRPFLTQPSSSESPLRDWIFRLADLYYVLAGDVWLANVDGYFDGLRDQRLCAAVQARTAMEALEFYMHATTFVSKLAPGAPNSQYFSHLGRRMHGLMQYLFWRTDRVVEDWDLQLTALELARSHLISLFTLHLTVCNLRDFGLRQQDPRLIAFLRGLAQADWRCFGMALLRFRPAERRIKEAFEPTSDHPNMTAFLDIFYGYFNDSCHYEAEYGPNPKNRTRMKTLPDGTRTEKPFDLYQFVLPRQICDLESVTFDPRPASLPIHQAVMFFIQVFLHHKFGIALDACPVHLSEVHWESDLPGILQVLIERHQQLVHGGRPEVVDVQIELFYY